MKTKPFYAFGETVTITRLSSVMRNGYIQSPLALSTQVDGKHMRTICTPAKVHNIYSTTLMLLSYCFSLLIMIMMCQLSKCLFCVRVQRTDEVCDDRKSILKQQQRLCQICNRNRWSNNWISSETGGLRCISPLLHIVQAYKHRWVQSTDA